MQALIVLNLIAFSIETLPEIRPRTRLLLNGFEAFSVALFTIEYFLRIYVAKRRLRFIFSFYGLVDLFAILPFYLINGLDLRSLRSMRMLRVVRTLKLARYSLALARFRKAIGLVREELVLYLGITLVFLYIAAVGIYYFEHPVQPEAFASVFHSLWWALATLTTVGYGDVYPITLGGRIFTFFILMLGLGIVAAPCGMLASALSEARRMESKPRASDR